MRNEQRKKEQGKQVKIGYPKLFINKRIENGRSSRK